VHESARPALAPDLLVLTTVGCEDHWMAGSLRLVVVSGPRRDAAEYLEGLELWRTGGVPRYVPAQPRDRAGLGGQHSGTDPAAPGRREASSVITSEERTKSPRWTAQAYEVCAYLFPRRDPESLQDLRRRAMVIDVLGSSHTACSPTAPGV